MKSKFILSVASVLLALSFLTMPVRAATGATTVNIALLDMSSVAGQRMTGMGMMRPGQGMMGQSWGMMTPGQGAAGPGWGMMSQGQGQGMMGMGMMSIRVDQPTVKAGNIHFEATNWSRGVVHEMLVVAVDNPNAPLPYDYDAAKIPEDQVKALGEVAELQPNASGSLDLKLAAGSYLLICNVAGHYAAGMVTPFTVTP